MYTALYRKMRSRSFADLVGQEAIARTIKNQVVTGRVVHAYLFCGIRGTGKTTIARILARAVNCPNAQEGEPCNVCDICKDIINERSMNIIEINAADFTGVDNVRSMIEECIYQPTAGNFKVYIIDEVHMFSNSSFNALLKTLEEPPAHVIFILATTDPQKIPETILSRCQRFDLSRISASDITQHLKKISEQMNIAIDDDALMYIAVSSDGSMRDALNLLEQSGAYYFDVLITEGRVRHLLGAVDTAIFFELTESLYKKDAAKCMDIISKAQEGRDIQRLISELIRFFRDVLVAGLTDDPPIEASAENIAKLRELALKIPANQLVSYIKVFSELSGKLKHFPHERLMLEVACISLTANE